jgi:hypothetical protein
LWIRWWTFGFWRHGVSCTAACFQPPIFDVCRTFVERTIAQDEDNVCSRASSDSKWLQSIATAGLPVAREVSAACVVNVCVRASVCLSFCKVGEQSWIQQGKYRNIDVWCFTTLVLPFLQPLCLMQPHSSRQLFNICTSFRQNGGNNAGPRLSLVAVVA